MTEVPTYWPRYRVPQAVGVGCGLAAAAAAVALDHRSLVYLLGCVFVSGSVWWILLRPSRWLSAFFAAAILTPPLPLPGGDSGLSIAPFAAGLALPSFLIWRDRWRLAWHPVAGPLIAFVTALLLSLSFALLYSGWAVAAASFARICLFGINVLTFFTAYAGPLPDGGNFRVARCLFGMAVAAAIFACADFYFQFPAPAGFGDQYVWLDAAVLRRAQGLFYEASTLGNFCVFFFVMAAVALLEHRSIALAPRAVLAAGALALAAAMLFSYSRASVINAAVSIGVLAVLRYRRFLRIVPVMFGAVGAAALGIHLLWPELSTQYWGRLFGSFTFFAETPNRILSGRLDTWTTLGAFLADNPWHALFGVGYKTLPYSDYIGARIIADNTYLALLVETGAIGLGAFLALNFMILRTGWQALHVQSSAGRFLGAWIFCFWCGQLVQMISGDLITYWRVLPIYFWVLGAAARETEELA